MCGGVCGGAGVGVVGVGGWVDGWVDGWCVGWVEQGWVEAARWVGWSLAFAGKAVGGGPGLKALGKGTTGRVWRAGAGAVLRGSQPVVALRAVRCVPGLAGGTR